MDTKQVLDAFVRFNKSEEIEWRVKDWTQPRREALEKAVDILLKSKKFENDELLHLTTVIDKELAELRWSYDEYMMNKELKETYINVMNELTHLHSGRIKVIIKNEETFYDTFADFAVEIIHDWSIYDHIIVLEINLEVQLLLTESKSQKTQHVVIKNI